MLLKLSRAPSLPVSQGNLTALGDGAIRPWLYHKSEKFNEINVISERSYH